MKIYTKTGDSGQTGLQGGVRVPKHDSRVDAYGNVDELNSAVGHALAIADQKIATLLAPTQTLLFNVGTVLSFGKGDRSKLPFITMDAILTLEEDIDEMESHLPALRNFIMPGGCDLAARLHLARSVCRRAERSVSYLLENVEDTDISLALQYLNRFSDYLFVMARFANFLANVADIPWTPNSETSNESPKESQ
ncbi:cob(I)yrinic acid a,c-diamide adenosyltransferase [Planctomycetota bacterium]|nr:cob(I)yrinic acid a,c-diamide adenosyltransferase [Planctomycetota bacterium]